MPSPTGAADASAEAGNPSATLPGDDGTPPPATPVFESKATFVALFPSTEGALVVASDGVRKVGRDGTMALVWSSPREVTAAAYDGTLLAVADRAAVTTLDASFVSVASVELTEACTSAIVVSGARLVCSPENDWDHVFYVFDLKAGKLLNTSPRETYRGVHVRSVAGTDEFVTVLTTSPPQINLRGVTTTNAVDALGAGPERGTQISEVYAVVGVPGTHVLTETGVLLKIHPDPPTSDAGPRPPWFFKDGNLGTLGDSQTFVALDSQRDQIYGLVSVRNGPGWLCASGCWLQHLDATKREIVSTRVHRFEGDRVLAFRQDTESAHAWLVTAPPGDQPYAPGFALYRLEE